MSRLHVQVLDALQRARTFIRNGVDLGYVRMPDPDLPDPAHETLPKIEAAILALAGKPSEWPAEAAEDPRVTMVKWLAHVQRIQRRFDMAAPAGDVAAEPACRAVLSDASPPLAADERARPCRQLMKHPASHLTAAEMRALGAAVNNFNLMVGEMRSVEGVTTEQVEGERAKVALAKRALKKLRAERKASKL